jgi:hypothetical protein
VSTSTLAIRPRRPFELLPGTAAGMAAVSLAEAQQLAALRLEERGGGAATVASLHAAAGELYDKALRDFRSDGGGRGEEIAPGCFREDAPCRGLAPGRRGLRPRLISVDLVWGGSRFWRGGFGAGPLKGMRAGQGLGW